MELFGFKILKASEFNRIKYFESKDQLLVKIHIKEHIIAILEERLKSQKGCNHVDHCEKCNTWLCDACYGCCEGDTNER